MVSRILMTTLIATISLSSYAGTINVYGAGGPHHAFEQAAAAFISLDENRDVKINITYGPLKKWEECAKSISTDCQQKGADILWGTSEHVTFALMEQFKDYGFNNKSTSAIYLRPAVIIVQKGNPKKIDSFSDLINRDDIKKVVVNNQTLNTLTSGTGIWEDIAGREGKLDDIQKFRKKIIYQGRGSGDAFKYFDKTYADAWISWPEWYASHSQKIDIVNILSAEKPIRSLKNIILFASFYTSAVDVFMGLILKL
ncbi:substrate-binding domain-containing protein [Photobacterium leiognathi]|uniref:substrate-binding domain-containing protein n=1 Tax=Photobacterium leiognathi TaxID=553611 RepID=UPI002981D882|nr:substrate-binding domain-containing protein [Photobacterium leiognathi]